MTPRRVLFAAADSAWAGAQAQMLELMAGLDPAEWEPVLLSTGSGGLIERARRAGFRTHVLPFGLLRRRFPFLDFYLAGPLMLRALLRRERIALVHAHDPNSPIALAPVAGALGIPVVSHIHDLDQRWVTRRSLEALARARSVLVGISDATVRWAADRGAPAALLRRVYNGVHLPPPMPGARARVREELALAPDDVAVGLVARFVERKGQEDAIRAFAEEPLRKTGARLFLVGGAAAPEREYEQRLRDLVAELGLDSRVAFLGERDDVSELLAGMDLSLVPAKREAFGRVVIEGMHAGTPMVVYDHGALPELVRHGTDGLVVPTGDVPALAACLAWLATDPQSRARMSASARARATEFTHERFVSECAALYRELLGAGKRVVSSE